MLGRMSSCECFLLTFVSFFSLGDFVEDLFELYPMYLVVLNLVRIAPLRILFFCLVDEPI